MKNYLLAIDIGNTNTVLGVFDGDDLLIHWRIGSKKHRTVDEYGIIIKELFHLNDIPTDFIGNIIISCVVPPLIPVLRDMSKKYFSVTPLIIGLGTKTGMPILYDNAHEVGADRIVNAVAAYHKFREALIVVDFGTAITLDTVSKKGEYLGGAIYPGISIAMEALYDRTARLPKIEISKPRSVMGKTTVDSIRSGIIYGTACLIDGLVEKIKKEVKSKCRVIATGGMAEIISEESSTIEEVHPFLTLEGLRIIFYMNMSTKEAKKHSSLLKKEKTDVR